MKPIPSLPDPTISCDYQNVYAPSDDSYLLIDYFKQVITNTHFNDIEISEIKYILDLGTGTGIIAIFFQLLKNQNPLFNPKIYASDILEDAIRCAQLNETANQINEEITFLHSDLFTSFPENLKHSFNIIVFNPPYLPSSELINKDDYKKNIDYSWAGGVKGNETLINFLKDAKLFLNLEKKSKIYCITSSRTNLLELNRIINNLGYKNEIVEKRHIFFEDILLNKLTYKTY
ncbi:MAG: HemK2/MTQ2 family protein methyltransferase [Candidatus Hodarchaeota archaeon]